MGWWSRLIRWALVTKAGADTGQFPVQQVTYLGKAADTTMIFPYGMHANVDGDSIGPLLVLGGNLENRAMIPTSMTRRSQLASGDVEVYSPVSRSRVTIRSGGGIESASTTFDITATGAVTIAGTGITLDTPLVTATGALTVIGTVTGATIAAGSGFSIGGSPGVSGTFTTTDGKTVTVTSGIITSIV